MSLGVNGSPQTTDTGLDAALAASRPHYLVAGRLQDMPGASQAESVALC